jgi:type IV secretory pathway VirB3-like protein
VETKRRRVIRTLNRPRLIAGIEVRLFGAVFLFALLLFIAVSRLAALSLIASLILFGKKASKSDTQMPLLWLHSLHQGASYDPLKRGKERSQSARWSGA